MGDFVNWPSWPIYKATHIHGLHDVTVHQGDKFTLKLHMRFKVHARERSACIDSDALNLNIYDSNGVEASSYNALPQMWVNKVKVDTSNLKPGTYNMTAHFSGEYDSRFRIYEPCSKSATLTVLPKN